jgi:hypothetical protein
MLSRSITSLTLLVIALLLGCGDTSPSVAPGSDASAGPVSVAPGGSSGDASLATAAQDAGLAADARAADATRGSGVGPDASSNTAVESGTADGAGPASGDAGAAADAGEASDAGAAVRLPPVTNTSDDGPFRIVQELNAGPKGKSGLFRPAELGKGGLRHPVFVWGCGGQSTPTTYADQLQRIASHGFVVIAEVSEIGDNGAPLRAAIDWISAQNERPDSPFFKHVDTSKIGLGGHSIGSANSFLVGEDPRLTTTIHIAGGSLDDVNSPFATTTGMGGKRLVHPVAYICSMSDIFGNVEKTTKDYDNTRVPAWMTVMNGVDHVGAARSGLPATIAWLRWHLAGEVERRSAFLAPGGEFTQGIFVSRNKNW